METSRPQGRGTPKTTTHPAGSRQTRYDRPKRPEPHGPERREKQPHGPERTEYDPMCHPRQRNFGGNAEASRHCQPPSRSYGPRLNPKSAETRAQGATCTTSVTGSHQTDSRVLGKGCGARGRQDGSGYSIQTVPDLPAATRGCAAAEVRSPVQGVRT